MLYPRIIPCLLVHEKGLVKTVQFKNGKYVGDPINAVKIFNEKEVDELMVLDIDATVKHQQPDYSMIAKLAQEAKECIIISGLKYLSSKGSFNKVPSRTPSFIHFHGVKSI